MTTVTDEHAVVRLERVIPAPPHAVYRAWLEPDVLRRWMAPGSSAVTRVEVDERVGGAFRIWLADAGSDVGGFDGRLLELVPDRRIVLHWGFVGPDRRDGAVYDSLLTITLAEATEGATALCLVHEHLDDLVTGLPQVAENVGPGWSDVLATLASTIDSVA